MQAPDLTPEERMTVDSAFFNINCAIVALIQHNYETEEEQLASPEWQEWQTILTYARWEI
jgi:hypothetical protein